MGVNVTIAEGGQGRRMPSVSEIRTDNASGTDDWVPESEYLTGVKFISENGTYYAKDDGVQSWSKVTVNVPGAAAGMTIPTIADDYGIMVPTGETGDCMPTPPEGLIPDDWEDPEIGFDIDGIDGVPSIEGIDPISGEDIVIGIDPEGNKIEETLPSSISIEHNPFKMAYRDGEHVSLSGIRVYARKKDGTIWTSKEYPDGSIPLMELGYEPKVVDASQGTGWGEASSDLIDGTVLYSSGGYLCIYKYEYGGVGRIVHEGGDIAFAVQDSKQTDRLYVVNASSSPFTGRDYDVWNDGSVHNEALKTINSPTTFDGKDVYVWSLNVPKNAGTNVPINEPMDRDKAAWTAIYGRQSGGARETVTISWKRPIDNKTLETEFDVDVTGSSGSGSGGGASAGGGGGGGGTGGGAY